MKKNFLTLLIIAFSIFGLFLSAEAETITKPNTFADGTPAKASEVNDNFDTVYYQVNKVGTEIHIDSANHRVGIGTTSPGAKLTIMGEGAKVGNAIVAYGGTEGIDNDVFPYFVGIRARGTLSSKQNVDENDIFAFFGGKGYGDGFPELSTAGISLVATELHSASDKGSKIVFQTTENGETEKLPRVTIYHNGNVGIGAKHPGAKLELAGKNSTVTNLISAYSSVGVLNTYSPVFIGRRARIDESDKPTAVLLGDVLAYFGGKGHNNTAWPDKPNAGMAILSTESYSSGHGSKIVFQTTANGQLEKQSRMVINASGDVKIISGYTQLATTSDAPPDADCAGAGDLGRMKVDPFAEYLYICVATGWKVATLGSPAP